MKTITIDYDLYTQELNKANIAGMAQAVKAFKRVNTLAKKDKEDALSALFEEFDGDESTIKFAVEVFKLEKEFNQ